MLGWLPRRVGAGCAAVAAAALLTMPPLTARANADAPSRFELANRCVAIKSAATGDFVAVAEPSSYRLDEPTKAGAAAFHLKPSGLGRYLPFDQDGGLPSASGGAGLSRVTNPGPDTEWMVRAASGRSFKITSSAGDETLRVVFVPARRCASFPEAKLGATGKAREGVNPDGKVFGYADAHLHITAEMRAGGRVIHGESFDRFGITRALGGDEFNHGPDGSLDVTGNLLRTGLHSAPTTPMDGRRSRGGPCTTPTPTSRSTTYG